MSANGRQTAPSQYSHRMSRYSLLGVVSSNEAVTELAPDSASSRLCARYSTCGVFTRSAWRNSWNGCPAAAAAAVVDVLVATRPQAHHLAQLRHRQPDRGFRLVADLAGAAGRWRCGQPGAGRQAQVGGVVGQLEHDRSAGRLRGHQRYPGQVQERQLVLVRSLVEPAGDGLQLVRHDLEHRGVGSLLPGPPLRDVAGRQRTQRGRERRRVALVQRWRGLRSGQLAGPSSR